MNAARVCHNIIEITEMGEVGRPGDQSGMKIAELPLWNGIWPPVKEIPMRHELLGRWDNLDSLNQMPLEYKDQTQKSRKRLLLLCFRNEITAAAAFCVPNRKQSTHTSRTNLFIISVF